MNEITEAMKHVKPAKTYPLYPLPDEPAIDDETLARMKEHPDQFVEMTAETIDLVDQERFEKDRMEAWCIAQPLGTDERNGVGISIRRADPADVYLAVSHVYVGESSVLMILGHGDGFGVYRWIHEAPLMCAKTLDEAKEWGVGYCRRLCEKAERLLHLTELVATEGRGPRRSDLAPLYEYARKDLELLRADAPLDEKSLKLKLELEKLEDIARAQQTAAETKRAKRWRLFG